MGIRDSLCFFHHNSSLVKAHYQQKRKCGRGILIVLALEKSSYLNAVVFWIQLGSEFLALYDDPKVDVFSLIADSLF
jgi:hypothetical protein